MLCILWYGQSLDRDWCYTDAYVHPQSYDYNLEKVKMYTRVPLKDIVGISKGTTFFTHQVTPLTVGTGAYIISPLEEASRDPIQNAGFTISWLTSNQVTRMTSYSVRNSLVDPSLPPSSPVRPVFIIEARNRLNSLSRKGMALSKLLLSNAPMTTATDQTFAAFKALPVDPTRRQESTISASPIEPADEVACASSCKEAVDLIVEAIKRACVDLGCVHGDFVTEADVVR